ncbi:RNA dependent RNA polymerase-domain-containing protein [Pseudoneurospora amorphoporcata]|uniref:RNA-directed RNA polymerase n=1 Tax=Pseudoneurospora amorphoporcata TaxID=241081 RepID=A0AAN6SFR9_9PEZI|nr:RNA dependent RNA polymerase-domain-containing protein [Pseudoneurospora amorphoporcata]
MSGIPTWVEQAQHAALVSPDRSPRDQDARPRHASRRRSSQQRHRENTSTSQPPSRPPSRPSPSSPRPPFRAIRHYSRGKPSPFASFGPPPQPVFISREWKCAKTALIRVKDVPPGAKLQDIHNLFSENGHISYIELDEVRPDISDRGRRALVRFEPPPQFTDFLSRGVCRLRIGHVDHWVPLEIVDPKREDFKERTIKTQLGNTCPQTQYFFPSTLYFGVLVQPAVFMRKQLVQTLSSDSLLRIEFDFKRMRLVIKFSLQYQREPSGFHRQNEHYKLHIKFGVIKELCRTMVGEEHRQALVMTLRDPPVAYRKKDVSKTFGEDRLTWSDNDLWERVVNIGSGLDVGKGPVSLAENHQYVDLGRWLTYWIELDQHSTRIWDKVSQHLLDWNLRTKLTVFPEPLPNKEPEVWDLLDDRYGHVIRPAPSQSWNNDFSLLAAPPRISLPFDVRYQLEVCISQGIINEHNIDRPFLEKLMEFCHSDNSLVKDRARLILEYAADEYAGKRIFDPMELFKDSAALNYFPSTFMIPNHCAWVRRVTITPTRIYFSTPCVEPTNRVIRQWKYAQDYFIRIQFTDEVLEGRIRSGEAELPLFLRAYRVLQEGVAMGPWHWRFLAFGNSQIREAGAFMFCEQSNLTCDMMRNWMGRFSHIKVIAKYAARLGQCFSTTRLVPGIPAPRIVTIPDIETGGFCFTDGVGKISPLLAKIVAHDWSIDPPPSAYQFRMGGCKGVLVTWPDVKGMEVHIRKSQEKFVAEFNGLEVIKCSQFATATLNRQIIAVLSSLGVPDQVFVDMMEKQLSDFNAAMVDKHKATAILRTSIDENHMTPIIAEMLAYGFMESQEPFVRTLLQLWRSWSIKTLKEKARLNVEKSAFVLGCVDETSTLKGHMKVIEDWKDVPSEKLPQIFLQIPDDVNGGYKVITGTCVVGRNPSLHPGDIRVVEAVDVPALRHLRDVVVFPLTGDRDVPSMCSGGDLDGDDFFVIWDPLLIPKERSHPPMINEPVVGKELATEPAVNNLITFFVLYMKYNNLPLIAHAHLATADAEMDGVKSPKCLELATLHSMAVDYVKTGVPAEFPRRLDPKFWPHFMEKNKRDYHSATALGKLYDMVKREPFDMKENYQLPFDSRILKHTKCRALRDETLTKARRIKSQYDTAMRRVMCQLEIATEFEVWTAFVMSKPRVGSEYKLQENVGRESSALKQHFKDQCKKEAGGDLLSFVSAMYRVTYEEVRIALFEAKQTHIRPDGSLGTRKITPKTMPLVSFPWLFWDKLGELARTGAILQRKLDDGGEDMDLLSDVPLVSQRRRGRHNTSGSSDFMDEHVDPLSYTRTSDGKVIHYGQILNLFSHDDEDGDDRNDARIRNSSSDESTPGSDSSKSASNLSPVAEEDLLSFETPPASPVVKPASPEVDLLVPLPTLTKAELAIGLSGPVATTYTPPHTDEETVIRGDHSSRTSDLSASTSSAYHQPPTEQTSLETEDLLLDIYSASPLRAGTGLGSTAGSDVPVKGGPPIRVKKVMRMGHRILTPPLERTAITNVVGASQSESPLTGTVTASAIHDPFVSPSPATAALATDRDGGAGAGPNNKQMIMGLDEGIKKEEYDEESDEEVEEVELEVDEDSLAARVEQMAAL